jgi:hypothetical protein
VGEEIIIAHSFLWLLQTGFDKIIIFAIERAADETPE